MEVCGVDINFSNQNGYFFNADCMTGLKEFPDNYFDLAVVDPPYGGGLTENGGCQGWFSKYHQDTAESGGVRSKTDLEGVSTATRVHRHSKNSRQPDGTWGYPKWSNEQTSKKS